MSDHNEHACSECGSLLHYAEHCPRLNPTTPTPTEQLAPTPTELAYQVAAVILLGHYEGNSKSYQMDLERLANLVIGAIMESIATERAAREAAEKRLAQKDQIYLDRLDDFEKLFKRNETAEARLAEALHILKISGAGCTCGGTRIHDDENCPIGIKGRFLSSTTPPPILEEVTQLRNQFKVVCDLLDIGQDDAIALKLAERLEELKALRTERERERERERVLYEKGQAWN